MPLRKHATPRTRPYLPVDPIRRKMLAGGAGMLGGAVALGAGATGVAGAAQAATATPGCVSAEAQGALTWSSEFLNYDKEEAFRHAYRIQRSWADEASILHWYHFIMVAVPLTSAPRPVVRWEGIELSHHRRIDDKRFRLHGHNLSFPRDLDTGKFIERVRNPLTDRVVPVPPLALVDDPGMWQSADGVVSLDNPTAAPRPKYGMLRRESGVVKIDAMRVPPATWPTTFLEMGTEATSADLFYNDALEWLPADVCGSYVFPYPDWMNMGDAPGHMFAYWTGYKVRDVDQLPPEFTARAKAEYPQLLSVDMSLFDRPVRAS